MVRKELLAAIKKDDRWQDITPEDVKDNEVVFQKDAVRILLLKNSVGFDFFCPQYNVGTIYIPYNDLSLSTTGLLTGSMGEYIDITIRLSTHPRGKPRGM